jgi:photosystem II stability/assembly factor-like uncharacterized protein
MTFRSWPFRFIVLLLVALAALGVGLAQAPSSGARPSDGELDPARAASSATVTWLNPLPQGMNLSAVDFVDARTGWTVGDGGTILRTDDGGATWAAQQSGVSGSVVSVCFTDKVNGWASAYDRYGVLDSSYSRSYLLHTTDGGATWQKVDVAHGLYGGIGVIAFTDAQHGFALCKLWTSSPGQPGATVVASALRTTDGGVTWSRLLVEPGDNSLTNLTAVTFASASRGWIVGSGNVPSAVPGLPGGALVYRTDDGGATWTRTTAPAGVTRLESVSSSGPNDVWVTGLGGQALSALYHSTDGGQSWSSVRLPSGFTLATASFASATSGWVSGTIRQDGRTQQACILHTQDGGVTWATAAVPDLSDLGLVLDLPLAHVGDSLAWCVGIDGFMARTQDGVTWQRIGAPAGWQALPPRYLNAIEFTDTTHGWVVGQRGTIWQTQGGNGWQPLTAPRLQYSDVDFVDAAGQKAFALGFDGNIQRFVVVKTTDGGATWRRVRTNQHRQVANDLFFLNAQRGWTGGNRRHRACLLFTVNGGMTWRTVDPKAAGTRLYDLKQLWFSDALHGWAAAEKIITSRHGTMRSTTLLPTLVRTSDGGRTWREVKSRGGGRIDATHLEFKGARLGWAAGRTGVWRTTDGGATWRLSRLWHRWMSGPVRFSDSVHGWALASGNGGPMDWFTQQLFYTSDGGRTWQPVALPDTTWSALATADAGSAYVIGGNDIIKVTALSATP